VSDSPHLDRVSAISADLSAAAARSFVARRELLRLTNATELFSLKHLAVESGVEWALLRSVVRRQRSPYQEIQIPKQGGGSRVIHAPTDELKRAQRWILEHLVASMGPRHPNSYAYDSGTSTVDCAKRHVGATWLIKTDIHNFFPSITEKDVYELFRQLNYSPLLSFEIARICTWPRPLRRKRSERELRDFHEDLPYYPSRQGRLPQGAPTSGALANAVMKSTDERLSNFALRNDLVYTRYSDDMVFSGTGKFSRDVASDLLGEIRRIVTGAGFALHQRKSQLVPPGARKVVLGVMIGADRISILPEQRQRLNLYLHAIHRYGLLEFVAHRGFDSPIAFINHVYGWLAYLSQIDPTWTKSWCGAWETELLRQGIDPESLSL